jgi:hypothetical protein
VSNESGIAAHGVTVKLRVEASPDDIVMLPERRYPRRPTEIFDIRPWHPSMVMPSWSVDAVQLGDGWGVTMDVGKVQPRDRVFVDDALFLGATRDLDLALAGHIYGDNFEPQPVELHVECRTTVREMTREDLFELRNKSRKRT